MANESQPRTSTPIVGVLVPIKAFTTAKARLAPALDAEERAGLARGLARGVLRGASPHPVWVVCDDPAVAEFAEAEGARVCWTPGLGLNGALEAGLAVIASTGAGRVAIVHADLPFVDGLADNLANAPEGVVLWPDRHDDGTNVMVLPTDAGFRCHYGPGSARHHRAEAHRLGFEVTSLTDARLGWDVDVPEDLRPPGVLGQWPAEVTRPAG